MKKFFDEFKEFAVRGNAISLAVGVVIGGAFTAIVNSIIENLIQPILGLIMGNIDLDRALAFRVGDNGAYFNFGAVLMAIISFIITALVLFLIIKFINSLQKKKEEEPAADPEPSSEEKLLTEIRDLLSQK